MFAWKNKLGYNLINESVVWHCRYGRLLKTTLLYLQFSIEDLWEKKTKLIIPNIH